MNCVLFVKMDQVLSLKRLINTGKVGGKFGQPREVGTMTVTEVFTQCKTDKIEFH